MENTIKIIRQIVNFRPLLQHLVDLKEKSKEFGLTADRKKEIFGLRLKIIASIAFTIATISVGTFVMVTFVFYLYKTSQMIEKLKNEKAQQEVNENPYKKFIADHPKIYSRVLFKHAGIYALSRDLTDQLETKEKKLLKIYLYIKDNVQFIDDNLPKSVFYFPDEVLEEKEGNSRETTILAASMLRDIGIGSNIIESGNNMFLRVGGINTKRYKEAMENILEDHYVLFEQDFVINSDIPMIMKIPERLTGVDLSVTVFAKHPIIYEIIDSNENKKESYSRDKLTIETIKCRFEKDDCIRVSTGDYPIVEASVTFSINKTDLVKMMDLSNNTEDIEIDLSFTSNSILAFLGKKQSEISDTNIYPVIPRKIVPFSIDEI